MLRGHRFGILATLGVALFALSGCLLSSGDACDSVACADGERCMVGADGLARCVADDPCRDVPCPANSHCEAASDTLAVSCVCDAGYELAADRLSCVPQGTTECSLSCEIYGPAHCEQDLDGEECVCNAGYAPNPQGDYCVSRGTCDGIDCSTYPNTHCELNEAGGPICACDPGYVANADASACIESGADPCTGVSCAGHGTCVDDGGPSCVCDAGWHPSSDGATCIEDGSSDPCEGLTCSGHGTCGDFGGVARCTCDPGYMRGADPRYCVPEDSDPCAGVTCSYHGTCGDFDGVARCACDPGYTPSADGRDCVEEVTDGYVWVSKGTGTWYVGDAVYIYVDGAQLGAPPGEMTYFSVGSGCTGVPPAPSCGEVQAAWDSSDRWCREVLRLPAGTYTLTAMLNRGGPDYAHWSYPITVRAGECTIRPINYAEHIHETAIVRGYIEDSYGRKLSDYIVTSDDGARDTTGSDGFYELTVDAGARQITADGSNGRRTTEIDVFPNTVYDLTKVFFPQ